MSAKRHAAGRTCIGISGWTYAGWRGVFYPEGLPRRRELEYVGQTLDSVEINGSFYSLQRPTSYRAWYEQTPDDFVFAVKGSRFITHMLKLKNAETALANFFASGVLRLADKLGPILWQFPERMQFNEERFAHFLDILPRTHSEAAKVALGHDDRLLGRAWTDAEHQGAIRHAFEIRHPGFLTAGFLDLLRAHDAAFVFADTAGRWPYTEDLTAGWVYVRLHGAEQLYASGYSDSQLDWWAARIREWRRGRAPPDATCVLSAAPDRPAGRDVYVYFDNDAKVHAPFDAIRLAERLGSA
ncbi:MAG TPA: DUF72 domain-containing protein [Longimicrobium sp.]